MFGLYSELSDLGLFVQTSLYALGLYKNIHQLMRGIIFRKGFKTIYTKARICRQFEKIKYKTKSEKKKTQNMDKTEESNFICLRPGVN